MLKIRFLLLLLLLSGDIKAYINNETLKDSLKQIPIHILLKERVLNYDSIFRSMSPIISAPNQKKPVSTLLHAPIVTAYPQVTHPSISTTDTGTFMSDIDTSVIYSKMDTQSKKLTDNKQEPTPRQPLEKNISLFWIGVILFLGGFLLTITLGLYGIIITLLGLVIAILNSGYLFF